LRAYQTYNAVIENVNYLKSIEMPLIVDVTETDVSVNGVFEWLDGVISGEDSDYPDEYSLIEEDDIEEYVDDLRSGIKSIQNDVDSISSTYESSQALYNYLKSGDYGASNNTTNLIPVAMADYYGTDGCSVRDYENQFRDVDFSLDIISSSVNVYDTEVSGMDDNICSYLDLIGEAAVFDYEEQMTDLSTRVSDLSKLFDVEGTSLSEITSLFTDLSSYIDNSSDPDSISSATVRDTLKTLDSLYTAVQNVQFVTAKITASVKSGNAPLIVRFDVLESSDPSNETIEDSQVTWDLDGDGDYDDAIGDTTSYTYDEAGSYRVGVRIVSSDDQIAAGVSYLTIKVEPASSVIKLTATAGGESSTLADYSTFPKVDKKDYRVTLTEATSAISFDASDSTDGSGNPLIYYSWEFGDGEVTEGANEASVTHLYGEAGRYSLVLTVTDSTGVQDRKVVNVYVGSPAARISVSPSSGEIGTTFRFSGAGSTTDIGTIVSYQWSATLNGTSYDLDSDNGVAIDTEFDQPGVYTITLTISDSSGNKDVATTEILVESQTPTAKYEYTVPNEQEPATFLFDASESSDPDPQDELSYEWVIEGVEGEDWRITDSEEDEMIITVQFLNKGTYEVALTVRDQHEEDLQKSDSAATDIEVDSVLDVDLELGAGGAYQLDDDGTATATFTGMSSTASALEIDYGDGETEYTTSITSGVKSFSHQYEQAGLYYVTLTAYDDEEVSNSVTKRLYIAAGDQPIAIINIEADGVDVGFGDEIKGTTETTFTFDGSSSVNLDGNSDGLRYSWNFDDGTISDKATVTHSFDEHNSFDVSLTVRDEDDESLTSTTTVKIVIEGIPPSINGVSITPQGDTLETPLKVSVSVDTTDRDGKISYIKAWYYDVNDSAEEIGNILAQSTTFSLLVNTKGEEADEVTYGFVVEVTDDDGNTVSSIDELSEDSQPMLTVVNGPNDNPVAEFSVDRTSIYLGEELTFTSEAYDPDGEIISYTWDVEGDGFSDNEAQEGSTYTYTYTQVHPDGVNVKLQVEDDSSATATSDELTIFVDSLSEAPDAAFLTDIDGTSVNFHNNSMIDTDKGAEFQGIYWDFDTTVDADGNGEPDDDVQELDNEDPSFDYEEFGTYSVLMTVVDTTGQYDTVKQDVVVKETDAPEAAFTYTNEELLVTFDNNSQTDTTNDVGVREYIWDFDLDTDSDGNGEEDDDSDSDQKNPEHEYEQFGTYEVQLTIVDSYGKTDSITQFVEVGSAVQDIEALLTSSPAANSKGQVTINGSSGYVTFFYGADGGSGNYSFEFDKNVFFDTKGDGVRDNDADYTDDASGSWKTYFDKSYGQIVVKLTVTDEETGETAVQTMQVVFSTNTSANLFNARPNDLLFFIISALFAAILGVTLSSRKYIS
jgi:PKD repeat protein